MEWNGICIPLKIEFHKTMSRNMMMDTYTHPTRVAQLVGRCPVHRKVARLIPSQGMYRREVK